MFLPSPYPLSCPFTPTNRFHATSNKCNSSKLFLSEFSSGSFYISFTIEKVCEQCVQKYVTSYSTCIFWSVEFLKHFGLDLKLRSTKDDLLSIGSHMICILLIFRITPMLVWYAKEHGTEYIVKTCLDWLSALLLKYYCLPFPLQHYSHLVLYGFAGKNQLFALYIMLSFLLGHANLSFTVFLTSSYYS